MKRLFTYLTTFHEKKIPMITIGYGILLAVLLWPCGIFAGTLPAVVSAKLDTNQIRIGEQFHLELTAITQPGIVVTFPVVPDSMKGIEVVKRGRIDTIQSEDKKNITYRQLLQLTSFDSGYYVVEPFLFRVSRNAAAVPDSMLTEAQLISVKTIPVDTTREIKDIKPTLDVPFSWKEWLPWILGALLLGVLVYFVIREIQRRSRKEKPAIPAGPPRPAHLIALEALRRIEEEKLWQQGYFKKYHSDVSDTLRAYIENRFDIQSMELTTDETLAHFRGNLINDDAKDKLRSILVLADLVKFAKTIPVANENEQSIMDAYSFISLTKQVDEADFKEAEVTT